PRIFGLLPLLRALTRAGSTGSNAFRRLTPPATRFHLRNHFPRLLGHLLVLGPPGLRHPPRPAPPRPGPLLGPPRPPPRPPRGRPRGGIAPPGPPRGDAPAVAPLGGARRGDRVHVRPRGPRPPPRGAPLVNVIERLRTEVTDVLKKRFVGRDEVVDLMALAVVA